MNSLTIKLNNRNTERADELARQTGKTPEQLVNEAFERFAGQVDLEEEKMFLEWRDAAKRLAGIWKDRDDLPDFEELRKSWDRGHGLLE